MSSVVPRKPRKGKSLAETNPSLAAEWHSSNPFGPECVSPGSHYVAKWVCVKDARHVYPSRVLHRTHGRGCGVCHGTLVLKGVNDIPTTHPELAAQWSVNNTADIRTVSFGSNSDFLWVCAYGHEYPMSPNKKSALGYGCPVCSGDRVIVGVNDLATTHPDLAQEVHHDSAMSAREVTQGSGKLLTWQCTAHPAHKWNAAVSSRVRGTGCPICSGHLVVRGVNDLITTHPHLAAHWHPSSPPMTRFHEGSRTLLEWLCPEGHTTTAIVRNRARRGQGCSVCSGALIVTGVNDLATRNPSLAEEWHPDNETRANEVALNSNSRVKWQCLKNADHVWEASPNGRVRNGCPHCVRNTFTSKGEKGLASWVTRTLPNAKVMRNARSVVKGHELDIYVPHLSLAIEFNGNYYHSDRFRAATYHRDKYTDCQASGVRLVQITECQWESSAEAVKALLIPLLLQPRVDHTEMVAKAVPPLVAKEFHSTHALLDADPKGESVGVFHGGTLISVTTVAEAEEASEVVAHTSSVSNSGDALREACAYAERRILRASEWLARSNAMVSDGGEFLAAGFTSVQNLDLSYKLLHRRVLRGAEEYPKSRFKEDPALRFQAGLTVKQLCELNNIPRVYDAGGTLFTRGSFNE